jgi:hypothetical protein
MAGSSFVQRRPLAFVDTIRSLRSLALGHRLGHRSSEEQDAQVSLFERLVHHAKATAGFSVYYGRAGITTTCAGARRTKRSSTPSTARSAAQQPAGLLAVQHLDAGLAWAMLGFAEQLEFLATVPDEALEPFSGRPRRRVVHARSRLGDVRLLHRAGTASDGIPYWDTGAPGLAHLPGWQDRPADPFNEHEPVDSSARLHRRARPPALGRYLQARGDDGTRYVQAGLSVLDTLADSGGSYLSIDAAHEGLILHSVYHRPNGWDREPEGSAIPRGESSQWGDYHAREAALVRPRDATNQPYLTFFGSEAIP